MLVPYLFWFIASALLSNEVNGAHFLSNVCTNTIVGTFAYPGIDNVYFNCQYGNATVYTCPPDTIFDPTLMKCNKKKILCFHHNKIYPHPFNCKKYIKCLNSEIKIIDCRAPMVYSIDTNQCEHKRRVSACRYQLADNNLRADLNTHLHNNMNEIIDKKRDTLHEFLDSDEKFSKESDKFNGFLPPSDNELDTLILENLISDNISSEQYSPTNSVNNMGENDTISIKEIEILSRVLSAPFNIAIKKNDMNETSNLEITELLNYIFFDSSISYHANVSNETNGSINNSNQDRQVFDDRETTAQRIKILSLNSSFSPSKEPEEKKLGNVTISGETHSTFVLSQKIDTSTLVNTVPEQAEDITFNTTPTIEKTPHTEVLEQHSGSSILPSTTLKNSENPSISAVVTEISTSTSAKSSEIDQDYSKIFDDTGDFISKETEDYLKYEPLSNSIEPRSLDSDVKLKKADTISEIIENTPMSTPHMEVTSLNTPVNRISEEIKTTIDRSEPEHSSTLKSPKNDEALGEATDSIVTIVSTSAISLATVSSTDNPKIDEIPVISKHISDYVESQRIKETSTLPYDNLPINVNDITNQEIPDAPKIQNEEPVSLLDVDSEIAQVEGSNDDQVRPSRSIEPADFPEVKNDDSFVYTWHNGTNNILVSVSRQRLRLNGATQTNYGYVEVKGEDGVWRIVCHFTYWTIAEADIVCRELGYRKGAHKAWKGHSNQVEIPAWTAISSIECDGDEEWVDKCRFQDETECDLQHDAVGYYLSPLCSRDKERFCTYPRVCDIYFSRDHGNIMVHACEPGLAFDPVFTRCGKAENLAYCNNDCSIYSFERLPHLKHCHEYIECIDRKIYAKKYKVRGTVYDMDE